VGGEGATVFGSEGYWVLGIGYWVSGIRSGIGYRVSGIIAINLRCFLGKLLHGISKVFPSKTLVVLV
jgi:hypothetical protein